MDIEKGSIHFHEITVNVSSKVSSNCGTSENERLIMKIAEIHENFKDRNYEGNVLIYLSTTKKYSFEASGDNEDDDDDEDDDDVKVVKVVKGMKGVTKDGNMQVQCQLCFKTMRTAQLLRRHLIVHAKMQVQCQVCFKNVRKDYLKRHLIVHADKQVQCQLCFKTMRRDHLKRHWKIHSMGKTFSCQSVDSCV